MDGDIFKAEFYESKKIRNNSVFTLQILGIAREGNTELVQRGPRE